MSIEELRKAYKLFRLDSPEVYNPDLSIDQEWHEVLVGCKCNRHYVVRVNGVYHEATDNLATLDIICPFCKRSISEWLSAAMHSGGVFNAVRSRRS